MIWRPGNGARGPLDRFLHDQNVERFVGLLMGETDPQVRARLHDLLIEEEDRFGLRRERLQQLRDHIDRLRVRMLRQEQLISVLTDGDCDAGPARQLHANWSETLRLLERYRDNLLGLEDSF